ncbi:toxin HipA [Pedobacter psychrophilus]|uniref:Toxin HipA n=1 Tax=Pedobacter psychrophilus TaxID=1826909 RepID=A0A179DP64_9SPHI|nr:type II toxin-antitoxin system HipA family toxin [Pedobacter psychrophilus]OAQ42339.1 toxin HipA [Pedobacter psychrophilus]
MVDVAEIRIWGELVGAVKWNQDLQLATFEYAPIFFKKRWDLSPIKMPLANGARIYSFPELRKNKDNTVDTFKGLPGLLADVLPDRYGNQLINIWLAQQGRSVNSMNPVEQLCFIGSRAMGALEFKPSQVSASTSTFAIQLDNLVDVAQKLLSDKEAFKTNLSNDDEEALTQILKIGTSAGGARPKAVIAYNEQTGEVRSGQTDVPEGFEHWLIKLDGVFDAQFGESSGWGKVEYAYYLMATECGIEMSDCKLLEEGARAHFMTKRFDRDNNIKHHVQTLCGINHFDYNNLFSYGYEQVFQTMRLLRLNYPEAEQMFKRMVFNVLATNCDDHTKNFSFRMKKNEKWELAPAYDVCYAFDPNNVWVNQQTLSVNGKHRNISKEDLMTIADANNIKKAEKVINTINEIVKQWLSFADKVGVRDDLKKTIQQNLHTFN